MNRIYRLIWNTRLRCWAVASEHTRSRGKPSSAARPLAAALCVLLAGPALANDTQVDPPAGPESTVEGEAVWNHPEALMRAFSAPDASMRGAGLTSYQNVLIGGGSTSNSTKGVAIGVGSFTAFDGVGIGNNAKAYAGGVALGIGASTSVAAGGTAVGKNARSDALGGSGAVVIGHNSYIATTGNTAVAIGANARVDGSNGTAVGASAQAGGSYAVALGSGAQAGGSNALALGRNALAPASGAIVIGNGSKLANANAHHAIVIGSGARSGGYDAGIAIGQNAVTDGHGKAVALGANANAGHTNAVALGAGSVTGANNQVSVGNDTLKRRIVNVADGTLSSTSSDVVTGKQLHATNQSISSAVTTANAAKTTADQAATKAGQALARLDGSRTTIGAGAAAAGTNSTAIGNAADAAGGYSNAVGHGASSSGSNAVALGTLASASGGSAVALGNRARTEGGNNGVAIGNAALAYNNDGLALGNNARSGVNAAGERVTTYNGGVAVGTGSRSGNGAVASGLRASATGDRAVAIGNDATADMTHATALGYQAAATANQATALGRGSAASARFATAVGNLAEAKAESSTALGERASASHAGSVALGNSSTTHGDNQVSVGSATVKRRIVNVADGTLSATSADAVTGKQLHATNQNLATVNALANTAHSIANDAQAKANVLGGLLSQSAGNSDVRLGAGNSGDAVDMRNQSNANRRVTGVADATLSNTSAEAVSGRQLHATNQNVTQVTATAATLSGLVGQAAAGGDLRLGAQNSGTVLDVRNQGNASRRISGVADGVLSAASTDAVSGRQLNTTNQNVTTATTLANTAHTVANAAQSIANDAQFKANVLGGLLSQASSSGDVRLGAANSGGVLDVRNQGNQARRVQGVAAGQLSATSDDAVSGRQLFDSNAQIARNRTDIDRLREDFEGFDPDLSDVVRFNADGNVDLDGGRLLAVGEGQLSADSREAVNGAQLFATNTKVAEQGAQIASAREDLDALRVDFDNYTPDLGSVVQFGEDGTVDLKAARLVALADGEIAAGSREAVTGGQLFVTNERVSVLEEAQKYAVVGYDDLSMPAEAGLLATAVGSDTKALAEGATAIGSFAQARGKNSVSLGRAALVHEGTENGFALGARSQVHVTNGVALGSSAEVRADATQSVALGAWSVAHGPNEVSLGHATLKRRITNAAKGIQGHDVTTVDQLSGVVNALGGGAGFAADGSVIAPSYGVQGSVHGTVADALAALDAGVDSNRGGLDAMDARFERLFDDGGLHSDGTGQLRLAGEHGMVLGNVANGMIAPGSRDAVNGGQLHAVQAQLNGRIDGLQSQIDGSATASRQAAVDEVAGESPADSQTPAPPVKDAPSVASTDTPKPKPEADDPLPQVDTRAVDQAVNQAQAYTDQAMASVDRRLDRMDKRLNRMAAMGSAQAAMAMNTAGLQTYNRLGAGVGHAEGESALAVGYQRVLNERGSATFSLNGAFTNSGERTVGVGFGVGW